MEECKIDNCDRLVYVKGLCKYHYNKQYKEKRKKTDSAICKIDNCDKLVKAKGLCGRHYKQISEKGKIIRTRLDKNEIKIDEENPQIAYINLYDRKNNIVSRAIIDTDNIDKVKNIKWKFSSNQYLYNSKDAITLNEVIIGKPERGYVIVHKNNDILDYRKDNLVVTKTNRRKNSFSHNTSGRKGVYKLNKNGTFTGKYLVYITVNKKTKYLGSSNNFNEAVKLREDGEREYGWLQT